MSGGTGPSAQTSAQTWGAALIIGFEGFRAKPYQDQAGVWTIGLGTTVVGGQPVGPDTPPCTYAQALAWLELDLDPIVNDLAPAVPIGALDCELAAVYSFAYNEGTPAFLGSTLLRNWRIEGPVSAASHFLDWVYVRDPATRMLVRDQGLVNRRNAEMQTFLGKVPFPSSQEET